MRRQRDEALARAWDNSQAFEQAVAELEAVTGLIVDAGDAYPPGVREVARRLTMELGGARTRLEAIRIRNGR